MPVVKTGYDFAGLAACPLHQKQESLMKHLTRMFLIATKLRGVPAASPVNRGVLQGSATLRMEPVYPAEAKRRRVSGSVVVEVLVDECGVVISARSLTGPVELRRASEDAALQWRFAQTKLVGVPIRVRGTITFNFHL